MDSKSELCFSFFLWILFCIFFNTEKQFMLAKNVSFLSKFSCGLTNFICLANFNYFNKSQLCAFGIWDKSQPDLLQIPQHSCIIRSVLSYFFYLAFSHTSKSFSFMLIVSVFKLTFKKLIYTFLPYDMPIGIKVCSRWRNVPDITVIPPKFSLLLAAYCTLFYTVSQTYYWCKLLIQFFLLYQMSQNKVFGQNTDRECMLLLESRVCPS